MTRNACGRATPSRPQSAPVPGPPSLCRQVSVAVLTTDPIHGPGGRKLLAGANSNLARASKCDRRGPAMG
jgi:hypothetical protein